MILENIVDILYYVIYSIRCKEVSGMHDICDIYKDYEKRTNDSMKMELQALIYIDIRRNGSF